MHAQKSDLLKSLVRLQKILQDFQRLLKIIHDLSHDFSKIAHDFVIGDNLILAYPMVSPSVTGALVRRSYEP